MTARRPPRRLERFLERVLPNGLSGQSTLGDLAEEFDRRAARSRMGAVTWYATQTASLVAYRFLTGSGTDARSDSDLLMDVRWSLRTLLRHPGFALGVISVLGLGIGANVAVYSVVDGTLDNTTWWAEPDRAVAIWPDNRFSFGQLDLYGQEQAAYRSLGGYVELAFALDTDDGESESVNGVLITPAMFRELAVQPALGRALADDDVGIGAESVVVISDRLWRRRFGADPAIVGSRIDVAGAAATVVGVQGRGAAAPGGRAELWLPLFMDPRNDDFWKAQNQTWVGVLRDGAGLGEAHEDLMGFTRLLSRLFPGFYPAGYAEGIAHVTRADEAQRRLVETPLLLLLGSTVLLLVVTALNVGNLLLGRSIDRRGELALRLSLGAARGRVVRQLMVEGLVLVALALGLALFGARAGGEWIARLFVEEAVVVSSSITSSSVLGFGLAAAAVAWLVLSGIPVAYFLRSQWTGPTLSTSSGATVQRTLVAVQASLATLLLVSATLLVATVDNLRRVPLGFDAEGLVAVELSPPADRVADVATARELYDRLGERVRALPGVAQAGLTGWLPLRQEAPSTPINLRSAPIDPREAVRAPMHMVDPAYFATLDIAPIDGRVLGTEDRGPYPTAVVVNESLADELWPDGSAVGQEIAVDPHAWNRWATVVGVVPNVRTGAITGPMQAALYVALAESPARDVTLLIRTAGGSGPVVAAVQSAVREVDPLVPVRSVVAMEDVVRAAYSTAWVMMGLLVLLAAFASGLGALGIYAVLAHHVSLTRREIGVRMALGAQPGRVVAGVVRSGLLLSLAGIGVGCVAAALTARLLESLLYQVSGLAAWAYVAPALLLAAAAALAAWVPAARAGRLPPAQVLRGE
jgi:predicted permease